MPELNQTISDEHLGSEHYFGRRIPASSSCASFVAAVAAEHAAGGGTVHVVTDTPINTAVTVPSDVRVVIEHGAQFVKQTGGSLTFNGPFEAPISQVFSGFASIDVALLQTKSRPEWFGAAGDGAANATSAFSSALASVPAGGRVEISPPGTSYLVTTQLTLRDYVRVIGGAMGKVTIKWAGTTGRCLDFESRLDSNTVLEGLTIDAQSGVTDHVIEYRNLNSASSSAAGLQLRDVRISGSSIPATKASLHLVGIKSLDGAGEGNVYGTSLWNCHLDDGGGTGLLLDYLYGTGGTTLTNVFGSSFSGNTKYGIHAKTFGNAGGNMTSPHGNVNLFGSLLQGNSDSAVYGDFGPLNIVGSYFEHIAANPAIKILGTVPTGPILIAGSTLICPNSTTHTIDMNGYGASGMLIAANSIQRPAGASAINLTFAQNSLVGPNRWTGSGTIYDWAGSSIYGRCLEIWDPYYAAYSESSGNVAGGGAIVFPNDSQWIDTTSIGIGVLPSQLAAYLHVKGLTNPHNAPVDVDGDAAWDVMKIEGGVGQPAVTAGKKSGRGSDIKLYAGAGGSSIATTTNGDGGNVEIVAGAAGSGAGSAGVPGAVIMGSTGHTIRHWGKWAGNPPGITAEEGDEYYDLTAHKKCYYSGSTWIQL